MTAEELEFIELAQQKQKEKAQYARRQEEEDRAAFEVNNYIMIYCLIHS